jgi:hypothetical protein
MKDSPDSPCSTRVQYSSRLVWIAVHHASSTLSSCRLWVVLLTPPPCSSARALLLVQAATVQLPPSVTNGLVKTGTALSGMADETVGVHKDGSRAVTGLLKRGTSPANLSSRVQVAIQGSKACDACRSACEENNGRLQDPDTGSYPQACFTIRTMLQNCAKFCVLPQRG